MNCDADCIFPLSPFQWCPSRIPPWLHRPRKSLEILPSLSRLVQRRVWVEWRKDRGAVRTSKRFKKLRLLHELYPWIFFSPEFACSEAILGTCEGIQDVRLNCS